MCLSFAHCCAIGYFPIVVGPVDIDARATIERQWIDDVGTLKPPRVYRVLDLFGLSRVRAFAGSSGHRRVRLPMRRRNGVHPPTPYRTAVNSWRDGLKHCAAAVCGRDILDRGPILRSAWRLAPGPWAYVYNRVNRH